MKLIYFLNLVFHIFNDFIFYENSNCNLNVKYPKLLQNSSYKKLEISIFPEVTNLSCIGDIVEGQIILSTNYGIFFNFINLLFFIYFAKKSDRFSKLTIFFNLYLLLIFMPTYNIWFVVYYLVLCGLIFIILNPNHEIIYYVAKKNLYKFLIIFIIFVFFAILYFDWKTVWNFLGIRAYNSIFIDGLSLPSGIKSLENGLNPYIENPFDPKQRVFVYPMIWLKLGSIINLGNELNFYVFQNILTFILLIFLVSLLKKNQSYYLLFLILSLPIFSIIERGQNDILILILLLTSVRFKNTIKYCMITLAAMLKIYPVFGFFIFLVKKDKKALLTFIFSIFYFIFIFDELRFVNKNFGSALNYWASFGVSSLSVFLKEFIGINFLVFLIFVHLIILFLKLRPKLITLDRNSDIFIKEKDLELFFIMSSIYCGLYLFTFSFDYKLSFLVFIYPSLKKIFQKNAKKIYIVLFLVFNFWFLYSTFGLIGILINLICKAILFFMFAEKLILISVNIYKNRNINYE